MFAVQIDRNEQNEFCISSKGFSSYLIHKIVLPEEYVLKDDTIYFTETERKNVIARVMDILASFVFIQARAIAEERISNQEVAPQYVMHTSLPVPMEEYYEYMESRVFQYAITDVFPLQFEEERHVEISFDELMDQKEVKDGFLRYVAENYGFLYPVKIDRKSSVLFIECLEDGQYLIRDVDGEIVAPEMYSHISLNQEQAEEQLVHILATLPYVHQVQKILFEHCTASKTTYNKICNITRNADVILSVDRIEQL